MPEPKKPLVFGKEEKVDPWKKYIPWIVIVAAIAAITAMIALNPKQKSLVCHSTAGGSAGLTSFGTCSED